MYTGVSIGCCVVFFTAKSPTTSIASPSIALFLTWPFICFEKYLEQPPMDWEVVTRGTLNFLQGVPLNSTLSSVTHLKSLVGVHWKWLESLVVQVLLCCFVAVYLLFFHPNDFCQNGQLKLSFSKQRVGMKRSQQQLEVVCCVFSVTFWYENGKQPVSCHEPHHCVGNSLCDIEYLLISLW